MMETRFPYIDVLDERFYWDHTFQGWLIKETDEWFVMVVPMIFNDRIVFGPQSGRHVGYDYGWCYDKGVAAIMAAMVWDPDVSGEPVGYKKAATGHRLRSADGVWYRSFADQEGA